MRGNSGFLEALFADLLVGTPECLSRDRAEVRRSRTIVFVEDVRIEQRSQQERNRSLKIEIARKEPARDAAGQDPLQALPRRICYAMTPDLAEIRMQPGIGDQ